jgi:alanine-glyoxylate transaminase / serine-glyoxylate transaminase / serine-pyruvate transaminase
MSLASGRHYHAIPGPTVVPDRVLRAMHRAAPNIYGGELHDMVATLYPDLRRLAGTAHHAAIYIGNGHAGWEAALANLFSRGERVMVLATGQFGLGWAETARGLGLDAQVLDFGKRAAVDTARLTEALVADRAHRVRAVLCTHVDTASTVRNDIAAIRAALDAAGHPALLLVDAIASLGCEEFRMDAWGVDVMLAASQKGMMTPPGLAVLWFNEKARAAGQAAGLRTPYWDWERRAFADQFYQLFCGTAPTHHLYGLREALDMLLHEEGLEAAWYRHACLARAVWAAFEAWGQGGPMQLNIADPARRAHAVTAARLGPPHATRLRDWTEREAGLTLGIGLGMADPDDPAWHGFFRLAHMGHVNAHMLMGALAVIDAGLKALDIPHGSGALEAAAQSIAGADEAAAAAGVGAPVAAGAA